MADGKPSSSFVDEACDRDTFLGSYERAFSKTPPRVKRARALLIIVAVAAFTAVGWLAYDAVDQRLRLGMQEQLHAIVRANLLSTQSWIDERRARAQQLASSSKILSIARTLPEKPTTHELSQTVPSLESVAHYFILDPEGHVRAHSEGANLPSELRARAAGALQGRGVLVLGPAPLTPPAAREEPSDRYMVLAARIAAGAPKVLVLAFDLRPLSDRFGESSWGDTGEVYAFDSSGVMLTESRFTDEVSRAGLIDPQVERTAFRLRLADPGVPLEAEPSPQEPFRDWPLTWMAERAVRGESGFNVEGYRNYLGREVVGAWQWLDERHFGIATEVSVSDAFASALVVRKAAMLLAALVLMASAGFALLGQWTLRVRRQSLLITRRLDRLARSLQPLSAALETDPMAVLLVDDALRVIYANPAANELLSQPLEGVHISHVFEGLSPELREALSDGSDTVVTQGENGTNNALLVTTRELSIDRRWHTLYMLRPITQELRRQEVEHWKKLIRVLSHELNNSLAPISSLASSARKMIRGTEKETALDTIFATISERTRHLSDFLESYRSIARLPRPTRIDVDWAHFVAGVRAQVPFELQGELPKRRAFMDASQMERVLINLLKNAHEAGGPADQVRVRITEEGDETRIDVLDRGTGMSRAVMEQAVLPFYSTKRTGTGVGLALSREIVEAHRGRLALANREGGGLMASVWLPPRVEHRLTTTL